MKNERDNFTKKVIKNISKRASYICSNPKCKALTISASRKGSEDFQYIGKVAHITAASKGGPRYNENLTPDQRKSIDNAIFLCSSCADMIDKNNGMDYSVEDLKNWKLEHEHWTRENLNKNPHSPLYIVDGEHVANGIGTITALDIRESSIIKPGTKSTAQGVGNITATRIGI